MGYTHTLNIYIDYLGIGTGIHDLVSIVDSRIHAWIGKATLVREGHGDDEAPPQIQDHPRERQGGVSGASLSRCLSFHLHLSRDLARSRALSLSLAHTPKLLNHQPLYQTTRNFREWRSLFPSLLHLCFRFRGTYQDWKSSC